MKDYRLSEIVGHCKKMYEEELNRAGVGFAIMFAVCRLCGERNAELHDFCEMAFRVHPLQWNVDFESRSNLPCKLPVSGRAEWRVYYRGPDTFITCDRFNTESEADEFLTTLKGGKK